MAKSRATTVYRILIKAINLLGYAIPFRSNFDVDLYYQHIHSLAMDIASVGRTIRHSSWRRVRISEIEKSFSPPFVWILVLGALIGTFQISHMQNPTSVILGVLLLAGTLSLGVLSLLVCVGIGNHEKGLHRGIPLPMDELERRITVLLRPNTVTQRLQKGTAVILDVDGGRMHIGLMPADWPTEMTLVHLHSIGGGARRAVKSLRDDLI